MKTRTLAHGKKVHVHANNGSANAAAVRAARGRSARTPGPSRSSGAARITASPSITTRGSRSPTRTRREPRQTGCGL